MITLKNLSKYYNRHKKNELHVINDTSLEFDDTGLVALLGPSGCGKTTLLNCIGGLDKAQSGEIYINGEKITSKNFYKMDKIRNLNIGYVFQDYKLLDDLTVFDNVALSLKMCGVKDKVEIRKRVDKILDDLGLYRYKKRPASMLSGGERQRVGIARALVKNPNVVICDEPTGNLDSRNSIEIMNIIKAISKEKLVILVTHETSLANLYADKIISLEDGTVKSIKDNDTNTEIDYEIDGKIYLKDLENKSIIKKDNLEINYYSDELSKININLVLKNKKLYIEAKNVEVENINNESSFELVNSHYEKINKSVYEKYHFENEEIENKKYASLYNVFSMIKVGFNRIKRYSLLKKLSLVSFFLAGALVMYSLSSSFAATKINLEDFNNDDERYVKISGDNLYKVVDEISAFKDVLYVYPGTMSNNFSIAVDDIYQTADQSQMLSGTYGSSEVLSDDDLLFGRLPEKNEVVLDKRLFDMVGESVLDTNLLALVGIDAPEKLIGREVTLTDNLKYKIVGISDKKIGELFFNKEDLLRIVVNNDIAEMIFESGYEDIYNVQNEITITQGKNPELNEVIVREDLKYLYPLNKKSDLEINGVKLVVVGYYKSNSVVKNIINIDTIKDVVYKKSDKFIVASTNKEETIKNLRNLRITGEDLFNKNKTEYINSRKEQVSSTLAITTVIFVITLVEIFFVIRASFQSRIKEVGILRAIGVKRSDIYKMFAGEIIVSTTLAGLSGILITYAFIYALSDIKIVARALSTNPLLVVLSALILYVFNVVVGLIPVWLTVRSTPANILSRKDI